MFGLVRFEVIVLVLNVVLIFLALLGHTFLWVAFINRIHGTAMPRWLINAMTLAGFACLGLIPLGYLVWLFGSGLSIIAETDRLPFPAHALAYLLACWTAGTFALGLWICRRASRGTPDVLRYDRSRIFSLVRSPEEPTPDEEEHHFLIRLPGNDMLKLDVVDRAFDVARLHRSLDRLSIVHLSDLHFTGRVGKGFFDEVVRLSNEVDPDLVAITGDLVDNAECIEWIPQTLGRLTARHGVYFVLGNHDLHVGADRIRKTLLDSGLIDLGGRWQTIRINDAPVVLAGNELPWIAPAADLSELPPSEPDERPLRIVLAHSPDQLEWARTNDVDLLLAGHLHGGQVRFPIIGPVFSPSLWGVRHACGVFHAQPTILHVSRGVSGQFPIRVNCPPEVARLTLHVPHAS